MKPRLKFVFLLLASLILSSCVAQGSDDALSTPSEVATPTVSVTVSLEPTEIAASPTPEPEFAGDGPWEVAFTTADGVTLSGWLFGTGEDVLVLLPTYPGGQEGWYRFAEVAAAQGYRVLTFDLRGYGASGGERDTARSLDDLAAVLAFLREHEAGRMMLMGAGLGGMVAIKAAAADEEGFAGLVAISTPRSFSGLEINDAELAALTIPSLWIGTRNDMLQRTEEMYDLAGSAQKELWIYEGSSLHGTYIFEGADGSDLERRLLAFAAYVLGEQ